MFRGNNGSAQTCIYACDSFLLLAA